jgi:hypothetical protein
MCMTDEIDDFVTMIAEGHFVKARKPHKCMECGRPIAAGESYHTESFRFDGEFMTHKTCAHCMVPRGWLQKECGGFVYNMIKEDLREHVTESDYYGWPLARLYVSMRNDWKRRDGSLRAVPAMPATSYEKRAQSVQA